jgi:hypothetical protein
MRTQRKIRAVLFSVAVITTLRAGAVQKADIEMGMRAVLEHIGRVRGQKLPKSVPTHVASPNDLRAYVAKQIREKLTKELLVVDSWSTVLVGMTAKPVDSLKVAQKFAGDQVAGFYDPKKKSMFITNTVPMNMLTPVLAHELTHFLQDQDVNLDSLMNLKVAKSDGVPALSFDEVSARDALIEGDAIYVMARVTEELKRSPGLLTSSDDVAFFLPQLDEEQKRIAKNLEIPVEVVQSVLFSYVQGYAFARRIVHERGMQGLRAALKCPPRSTREVLWSDIYLQRSKGNCVAAPVVITDRAVSEKLRKFSLTTHASLFRGDMGSHGSILLVQHHLGSAAAADARVWARAMSADAMYSIVAKKEDWGGLYWELQFESEDAAKAAYTHFHQMTQRVETLQKGWGAPAKSVWNVHRNATRLRLVWNLPAALAGDLLPSSVAESKAI